MLIGLAVTLLLTLLIAVESPIWLVVAIMALYALTSVGASVPITNAIMNTAPLGEGSASAFRAHPSTSAPRSVLSLCRQSSIPPPRHLDSIARQRRSGITPVGADRREHSLGDEC